MNKVKVGNVINRVFIMLWLVPNMVFFRIETTKLMSIHDNQIRIFARILEVMNILICMINVLISDSVGCELFNGF